MTGWKIHPKNEAVLSGKREKCPLKINGLVGWKMYFLSSIVPLFMGHSFVFSGGVFPISYPMTDPWGWYIYIHLTFTKKRQANVGKYTKKPMGIRHGYWKWWGDFPVCHVNELRGFSHNLPIISCFQATPGHATGVDAPLSTTTWAEREKGGGKKA